MKDDTNSSTKSKEISTAKLILDLASFIAMFLASILSSEKLKYWQGHKNEMKTKLREVLSVVFEDVLTDVVDEWGDVRRDWEAYYKKTYQWAVDFSEVIVPPKPEGVWRLVFVAKGITCDKVYNSWIFPKWKYMNGGIDGAVSTNIRTASDHYAVWVRDEVEPDAEFLGKKTNQVDAGMKIGMTLLERMILEGKYFDESGKHLDVVGGTFCSGSRDSDGYVPYVNLSRVGEVRVVWCGVDVADAEYGVRRAVST